VVLAKFKKLQMFTKNF